MDKRVELNNGKAMPVLGLGTWKSKPGEVSAAVKEALRIGYRHIDAAHVYGNEVEVGEGIKAAMAEFGVKREDLFVTSKLWNNKHHPDDVETAYKTTLSNLGLAYIDLYLMHWPYAFKRGDELFPKSDSGEILYDFDLHPTDTWLVMEKLIEKGLVKSIGLSNFNSEQIEDIIKRGKVKPVANQVECHPYLNQAKLLKFCQERSIILTAYSPLGSPDRPWATPDEPVLLDDPKLKDLAKRHNKSPAQIILKWQVQRGVVVIPKSINPGRIAENGAIFDFELSPEDMKLLDSFDKGKQGRVIVPKKPNGDFRDSVHPHFPFNIEF